MCYWNCDWNTLKRHQYLERRQWLWLRNILWWFGFVMIIKTFKFRFILADPLDLWPHVLMLSPLSRNFIMKFTSDGGDQTWQHIWTIHGTSSKMIGHCCVDQQEYTLTSLHLMWRDMCILNHHVNCVLNQALSSESIEITTDYLSSFS